jgi:diaminohydroxyphosphoribosylaminopyrimidine deaminase/5-amino-6-(5-phosphoribosylamino)uracil reductase
MASAAEVAAMERAVALSTLALGSTNPNPCVGAVVVAASGEVIGDGVTEPVGGAHAEIVALRAAGEHARGATLVVTLEPCHHTGRTGPCTDAIVAAGIARVVYALGDPHKVASGGGAALTSAGVDVEAGLLSEAAAGVLGPWVVAAGRGRPYLTWKYAATLDGRSAAADGSSRWITGADARVDVHRERASADAVIVGIGTVLADNPSLTVRDWPTARQPLRVVVDSAARTPVKAKILDDSTATMIAVSADADTARVDALSAAGADLVRLPRRNDGLDLTALLAELYDREARLVLVEGGATLAASFMRADLVDRVVGYHAAAFLGAGAPVLGDLGITSIAATRRLHLEGVTQIGNDVRVVARLCHDDGEGQDG